MSSECVLVVCLGKCHLTRIVQLTPAPSGVPTEWWLFPVLARMEFDTKERYKFFGCSRERACGIGSGPRKGHSSLRRCTPHTSRNDLNQMRRIIARARDMPEGDEEVDDADWLAAEKESWRRRGLRPDQTCWALSKCCHSTIRWPERIYHGLFNFDVMHHLYINCIGYLQEAFLDVLTTDKQKLLDSRVRQFTPFRNPQDGSASSRVTSLTSIGYLTAELKVVHLFLWSHAVGSKAGIFPEELRPDVLSALCSLQIVVFSVRGKRPFTEAEHRFIFQHHGKRFFLSLSNVANWKRKKRIRKALNYNVGKPPAKRHRVPYWRNVVKCADESSDTASSSEEDAPPFFLRSDKIVPHSFVHFADQVIMGGTHHFHDVAGNEACHKYCIQLAGQRARLYSDVNATCRKLLQFLLSLRLLREIIHASIGHETNDGSISEINPLRVTSAITADNNGLGVLYRARRGTVTEAQTLHPDTWDRILCEGVPLSVREITHLVASFLHMTVNVRSAQQLLTCSWSLGWHVTTTSSDNTSRHYWGGGLTPGTTSNYLRGDWIEVAGTENYNNTVTSRMARIVCGVQVCDCAKVLVPPRIPEDISDDVWQTPENKKSRTLTFLLVRYAQAHPHARRLRGPQHRPLCPGVLKDSHCLWSWAKRPVGWKRGCFQGRSWQRNRRLFGNTDAAREVRKTAEERAWYDVIQSNSILHYANLQKDPDRDDAFIQSIMCPC